MSTDIKSSTWPSVGTDAHLAIKFVAFGELAFVQVGEGSTHPGINEEMDWLDDDGDLIVVAVTEPVKRHLVSFDQLA